MRCTLTSNEVTRYQLSYVFFSSRITSSIIDEFDYIKKNLYLNIGWVDIWMTVYFYLCKKEYTVNPYFTEAKTNPNWMDSKYAIVHHYKQHYEHFGYFYE